MKRHELKTLPQYFEGLWSNKKTFEIRKNDRDFKVNDVLILREWDETYSGRVCYRRITYITSFPKGLKRGYVVMGFNYMGFCVPEKE